MLYLYYVYIIYNTYKPLNRKPIQMNTFTGFINILLIQTIQLYLVSGRYSYEIKRDQISVFTAR